MKMNDMTIEELDWTVRTYNCIKRAGINTVQDILNKTETELEQIRNIHRRSVAEIVTKMSELGYIIRP